MRYCSGQSNHAPYRCHIDTQLSFLITPNINYTKRQDRPYQSAWHNILELLPSKETQFQFHIRLP